MIKSLPHCRALIAEASPKHSTNFAESIITTDTCTKTIALREKINGKDVHICGIAKGSGMIMPDMATMLAFIITDAAIDASLLQTMLLEENELSFNRICVDGDMSTNDSVLIMAGGKSGVSINRNTPQAIIVSYHAEKGYAGACAHDR